MTCIGTRACEVSALGAHWGHQAGNVKSTGCSAGCRRSEKAKSTGPAAVASALQGVAAPHDILLETADYGQAPSATVGQTTQISM